MLTTVPLMEALELIWSAIQDQHVDLPDVVIRLGRGHDPRRPLRLTRGHWHANSWAERNGEEPLHEVMIAGERLHDGPEGVLSTLLHEAAHGLAFVRNIKDVSREGRYHNKRFKALAESVGLEVSQSKSSGWNLTELTRAAKDHFCFELEVLDVAITSHRRVDEGSIMALVAGVLGGSSSGGQAQLPASNPKPKRVRHSCKCEEPRSFYIAPGIAAIGPIVCKVCEAEFIPSAPG